jgi:hypothetical protein
MALSLTCEVTAATVTTGILWFHVLLETTQPGRRPACSDPRAGSKSTQ